MEYEEPPKMDVNPAVLKAAWASLTAIPAMLGIGRMSLTCTLLLGLAK